jgi:hypothetical protein
MRVKVPLQVIAGAAIGYVAGTAAGRRRYEQIRSAAGTFVHDPTVRDTASRVANTAASAATTAGAATVNKAKDVAGSVKDKIDDHRDSTDEAPAAC